MKRATRDLLRAVVRLAEDDLLELRDAVSQIDFKAGEAHHAYRVRDESMLRYAERLDDIEARLQGIENRV